MASRYIPTAEKLQSLEKDNGFVCVISFERGNWNNHDIDVGV